MPISREAGIRGMIEYGDGDRLITELAAQVAPAAARAPNGVAFLPFAGQVDSIDAGVIELRNGGRTAAGIRENLGLVGGRFQCAGDAHAEDAFLIVVEDDFFVESLQGRNAVDAPEIRAASEDETRLLFENKLLLCG